MKRSPKKGDAAQRAWQVVQEATGQVEETDPYEGKDPAAVELGRRGGQRGGKARAARLTPEERSEQAKRAAAARWSRLAEQTAPTETRR